ncbi:MAG: NADH-quinone oxidoreductase subunit F [bacterium]|nr:NADH-quinone oxidoreductase subunit F [bacterium]
MDNREIKRIKIGTSTCGLAAGAEKVLDYFKNNVKNIQIDEVGCIGHCYAEPIIEVETISNGSIFYSKVSPDGECLNNILNLEKNGRLEINPLRKAKECLQVTRLAGKINPRSIDEYIDNGGFSALKKVLETGNPEKVVQDVIASGIRGRGGGGFPTGIKWQSAKKAAESRKEEVFVVCNADEGDPGAFMDRSIIETNPYSIIEGMLIGAYAIGAKEGFVYIRKEYPLACITLEKAIESATKMGILGDRVFDTDFCFSLKIHRGAGAFVCGESSALMKSMTGKTGEPRAKYVRSVEYGFRDKPTVLNNVETWSNIPIIIDKGPEHFASIGTGDVTNNPWGGSSGTKVFSLVGDINNAGLVEVPMGITLREVIEDIGGGITNGRKFKAIQTGGPSGGCIPEEHLDMKIDFDSLSEAGSMMGSGGLIVMDDKTCMVDVARYFTDFLVNESCGKCTPCREGLYALSNTLKRICEGKGKESDIEFLKELADTITEASLCQLGGSAANPVLSTILYFRDEYEEHIRESKCRAGVCKPLITYNINYKCTGCTACAKQCPVNAISGENKNLHTINKNLCTKCGICTEVCKFDAVEVI